VATSGALVFTVAVATTQEERLAIGQVQATQDIEAGSIARAVADFVELNAAQTATIAATADRVPFQPQAQRDFLERTLRLYPRMKALAILDPGGRAVSAAGSVPLSERDRREIAAAVQQDPHPFVQLMGLPGEEYPRLVLSVRIGTGGTVTGALVSLLGADVLAQRIVRDGSDVYLTDGNGGRSLIATALIGAPEPPSPPDRRRLSPCPWGGTGRSPPGAPLPLRTGWPRSRSSAFSAGPSRYSGRAAPRSPESAAGATSPSCCCWLWFLSPCWVAS